MSLSIQWGACSDAGRVRSRNEDFYIGWCYPERDLPIQGVFAVADGMGGHPAGDQASQMAAQELEQVLRDDRIASAEIPARIAEAFRRAHEKLRAASLREPALSGMGTTLTALVVGRERLYAAHVGDSRLYELGPAESGIEVRRWTTDHTLAQEQAAAGIISEEQIPEHPLSHILTRSVGPGETPSVEALDLGEAAEQARVFLLCTDGLVRVVSEQEFPAIIEDRDPEAGARALVDAANERGAPDNVTVVIVRVAREES